MALTTETECRPATKSYFDFERDYNQSLAVA